MEDQHVVQKCPEERETSRQLPEGINFANLEQIPFIEEVVETQNARHQSNVTLVKKIEFEKS